MYNLVVVFTDENTTVEELLKPFGLNQKIQNKEVLLPKHTIITKEMISIIDIISEYRRVIEMSSIPKSQKEAMINSKNKLQKFIDEATDEEIYRYAIRAYDKELISPEGDIYNPYNPYAKWSSYKKDSERCKYFVIEDPKNKGELIRVSSAKVKDIKWDVIKYGVVPSVASIMPDGTWYDENEGTCIKVYRDKENKITLKKEHIGEKVINNNPEWVANIVEYYI